MYPNAPFGGYWWLLNFCPCTNSLRIVNQRLTISCLVAQNRQGTKPWKNKGKNSFARNVLFGISLFRLQRYGFVPEMTRGFPYFSHLQPTFLPFPCTSASCKRFARNGRQGGKVSVKMSTFDWRTYMRLLEAKGYEVLLKRDSRNEMKSYTVRRSNKSKPPDLRLDAKSRAVDYSFGVILCLNYQTAIRH